MIRMLYDKELDKDRI